MNSETITGIKLNQQEASYSHPIMVGQNADIKEGTEYIIKDKINDKIIYSHIVIPKGVKTPNDLHRYIIYKGKFSKIKNWERFKIKKPNLDYKYFLVESWEYKK
jgi:hypothetical protein